MEISKKNKKDRHRSHIPFRLNLLFFIVFLLFVTLIIRLGYLQIIKGDEFKAEVERTESTVVRGNVPRGEIYDQKLRPLVANQAKNSIMYTRGSNTKTESMAQIAYNLAQLIDVPHASPFETEDNDLSVRDLKDYFYATNRELMRERINQYSEENDIALKDISYSESLELIDEAELINYTDHDLKAAAIFTKMNSAYALSTVNIKNENVTQEEIAAVSENLMLLPGVTTGTDWDRVYPQGDTLRSVLGRVSTEEQGIPETQEKEYLAKGYSRNDRVGRSLLESQYETVLKGSKSMAETETDNFGDIIGQSEIYSGSKGHNLILTVDMDFQNAVDDIVLEVLSRRQGLNDSVYAVAMNPKNGDILAMSGKKVNKKGQIEDDTLGVITHAFTMGSSVKAATVLSGYMDEVISVDNNNIIDSRLTFLGSPSISSVFNRHGTRMMTDKTSIQYSSNVYMSQIAMRMGGYWNYQPRRSLPINGETTVNKMRSYYRQFGLGSETGIDLPNESTGQEGEVNNPGQALFLSFGQFDTYTLMQLAQYISTVANGGVRFAPKLVSEIRETNPINGQVGPLVQEVKPKIMNFIDVSEEEMKRVQEGLYLVVNGDYGFAPSVFASAPYTAAGKTGTAQAFYWDDEKKQITGQVTNLTFVGYAPYEDPEIAVAIVIPYLPLTVSSRDNVWMTRQIMDAYFGVGDYANEEPTQADTDDDVNTDDVDGTENSEAENSEGETESATDAEDVDE